MQENLTQRNEYARVVKVNMSIIPWNVYTGLSKSDQEEYFF